MEAWIINLVEQYGYMGIFLLIAIENIFPPIPSEVILTFSGFMTNSTSMTITGVVIISTAGSVAGAIVLYGLGRMLDLHRLEKIIDRYGAFLRLTHDDVAKADRWFQRYGAWTVLFCRLIPLVRSLISIPAGMARMNFSLFLLYTSIGTLAWNTVLVNLGGMVGSNWSDIVAYMDVFSTAVYLLIAVFLLGLIVWYIRRRRGRKQ
ncbi:DedA family protein [Bacillus testis]|uniref:DedA family protein n=1 Tax=Bacillus testis TaxID=1622072 RepID=UPI00067F7266|nr:DedA family protein [Bacillus testis]